MNCFLVLVTMHHSDDSAPDEIFGPFSTFDKAYRWMTAHISPTHYARVQQTTDPNVNHQHMWWTR